MIVYLLINMITGKGYVGQTVNSLHSRWRGHTNRTNLRLGRQPIAKAIRSYGQDAFEIVELEKCSSQDHMDDREIYWALHLGTFVPDGYNLRAGKGHGIMSDEVKRKIGDSNRGRKMSEDARLKMSLRRRGRVTSEITKAKLSAIFKGIKPSEATRIGASIASAKTFRLLNPQGEMVEIHNLRKFCVKHQLLYSAMYRAATGGNPYKGWALTIEIQSRPLFRTQCGNGHDLDGDNLRIINTKNGVELRCRKCARDNGRLHRILKGSNPWRLGGPGRPPIEAVK